MLNWNTHRYCRSQGYECPCNYNPADFLVATLAIVPNDADGSGRVAQKICDAFLTSEACNEIDIILQQEHDSARLQCHVSKLLRKQMLTIDN